MHRLLVPVDSSESAQRALKYAIGLAKEYGKFELHIVHAHPLPVVYGEVAVYISYEKALELQRKHSQDVLAPAVQVAKAAGVPFTSEVLEGDVPSEIVRCAKAKGCDGIVMGTRGMGAIGNLVVGSVATKIVHLAEVPVTLVK
jgi:nucleotide-binding universal stress UspA family protein